MLKEGARGVVKAFDGVGLAGTKESSVIERTARPRGKPDSEGWTTVARRS